jgi:hypothetical protein
MRFRRVSPVGRVMRGRVLRSKSSATMVDGPGELAMLFAQKRKSTYR